jgi:predicted amidophosphoribosyltransferase
MYCPNCKKTFPEDHAFCDSCGSKLVEGQATETTQTIPQPQDEPAPEPQPQLQPTPQA